MYTNHIDRYPVQRGITPARPLFYAPWLRSVKPISEFAGWRRLLPATSVLAASICACACSSLSSLSRR